MSCGLACLHGSRLRINVSPVKECIRKAGEDEASLLTELSLRAKAYWPYDDKFIEACRQDLTIDPEKHLGLGMFYVFDFKGKVTGFYGFAKEPEPELSHLFVEPTHIGTGIGHKLWLHALGVANSMRWKSFKILADPFAAEKFYFKRGCKEIAKVPSPVCPDRKIPLLQFYLPSGDS